jgi:DNA-binding LacI/PurR family transcriptional regulator
VLPSHSITIEDVARGAGVSVATVSRALRDQPQVNARTRTRVVTVARRLGYVPNRAARSLVIRATQTLGLLIPDATDPIHGQIVTGFAQEAAAHAYTVILANGFDDPAHERRALEIFAMHRADGVALMGSMLRQRETRLAMRPSPVVFVIGEHPALAGYRSDLVRGCIRADDIQGMDAVVRHLFDSGYRRVAYAAGQGSASDITRRDAVRRALAAANVGEPLRVYESLPQRGGTNGAVAAAIAGDPPDALICYDDKLAFQLVDQLREHGITVPRDIAVVGFDDIPFARMANPRLTTVAQPSVEIGRRAAAMLLTAIRTGTMPQSIQLPVRLVVRESTINGGVRTAGRPRN